MSVGQINQFASKAKAVQQKQDHVSYLGRVVTFLEGNIKALKAGTPSKVEQFVVDNQLEFNSQTVQINKPNSMKGLVQLVRSGEQAGGVTKAITLLFSWILLIAGLTSLVFVPVSYAAMSEYMRQTEEAETRGELAPLDTEIARLNSMIAALNQEINTVSNYTPADLLAWQAGCSSDHSKVAETLRKHQEKIALAREEAAAAMAKANSAMAALQEEMAAT